MRIFIIGNIASGKTFLAKLIAKKTGYTVYSIDNFRIKYNNFATSDGEIIAWDMLKKTVLASPDCIVESTGCSRHYDALLTMCPGAFVIKVDTEIDKCLKGFENRNNDKIPLPWKENIKASLDRNQILLRSKSYDIAYKREFDKEFWELFSIVLGVNKK